MELKTFFKIPAVQFAINSVILVSLVLNVIQFYHTWEETARIDALNKQLSAIQNANEDLKNPDNYLASEFYKERYAKQDLNMRKDGENILDTSYFEGATSDQKQSYTPKEAGTQQSNPQKWWNCFFASDRNKCVENY